MEEIKTYDDVVVEDEFVDVDVVDGDTGMSTGVAMAIGAGLAVAVGAAIKLGKKLWAKHKAKKELRQPKEGENVEVTDEQVKEITE